MSGASPGRAARIAISSIRDILPVFAGQGERLRLLCRGIEAAAVLFWLHDANRVVTDGRARGGDADIVSGGGGEGEATAGEPVSTSGRVGPIAWLGRVVDRLYVQG